MKIAIVSDTHNNWANFKKAIEWIKKEKIQLIFHCGDISSQETIDDARKLFENDIKFVKGNADYDMPDLPDFMELEIENKKVTFAHFPAEAKKMAQSGKYDMVFYGHTHKACLARRSLGEGGKLRFHRRLDAWQGKCHGSLQHASICNINQGTARSG